MAGAASFALPLISGGLSAAGSIFGGKNTASNVQLPQSFQMPNMLPAANAAYSGIQGLPGQNLPGQFLPQAASATQGLLDNPYAAGAQQGANVAGGMGQQQAQGQYAAGQGLTGAGQSLLPYAQQIMGTAFDPQNALYARTVQQLQDQTRASEAARGIATSPYGAGVENKAMSDFNIDWQNAQLGRQAQGAGAAGNLTGAAGTAIGQGQGLAASAPGQYGAASAMPYNMAQTIGRGSVADVGQLFGVGGQAQSLAQQPIQDYLAYLGAGNQAGGVANQLGQLGLNQNQLAFNQNQTLGANLGAGIQGMGSAFSNPNNMSWLNSVFSGGTNAFGGGTNTSPNLVYGPGN